MPIVDRTSRTALAQPPIANNATKITPVRLHLRIFSLLTLSLFSLGCVSWAPVDCAGCKAPFECVAENQYGDRVYFCGFKCESFKDTRCPTTCRSCDGPRCSLGDGTSFGLVCVGQ